jgi:hypothetical protein
MLNKQPVIIGSDTEVHRRFGAVYCLHIQGGRLSKAKIIVTPCSKVEAHGRLGGKYCVHLQDRKSKHKKLMPLAGFSWLILWTLTMEAACSS